MQEINTQEIFKAAISCKVFITLKLQLFSLRYNVLPLKNKLKK